MLQSWIKRIDRFFRDRKIAGLVRKGILPKGISLGRIKEALKSTLKPNQMEWFGFLSMRVFRKNGQIEDLGLQSCKKVTLAFANYVVDSLQNSTSHPLDEFKHHATGDNDDAEANSETELVNEVDSRNDAGTQVENGAGVFKSVATITYGANFTIREHALLDNASNGVMLDRSLVSNPPAVENQDSIEFTYELTVNAES